MAEKNLTPLFKANLILRGKIECVTGLHIGGSKEKLEIGGVDSIVVRSPRTSFPYIPGSSLKGKMRHLLEYITGALADPIRLSKDEKLEDALGRVSKAPDIVRLFGIGANERETSEFKYIGLTRLIVRDAHPDEKTVEMWENDLGADAHYTEYKAENTIDRLTSAANPRFIERVVEGSMFNFELVYTAFQMEQEEDYQARTNKDIEHLFLALRLLEMSALGKSGSRGYGKIRFHLDKPLWLNRDDYQKGSENWKKAREDSFTSLNPLSSYNWQDLQYQEI